MNWKLKSIAVALVTLGLSIGLTSVVILTLARDQISEIPQHQFLRQASCVEEQTPREFSAFWLEFRSAVQHEDKQRLFSMIRKCNFDWVPFEGHLIKPLEVDSYYVPFQLEAPFELRPISNSSWGQDLRFGTHSDFLANYEIVFSKSNRRWFLSSVPRSSTQCEYAISWRDKVLNHLCFENSKASGFKFSGIEFEP